MVKNVDLKKSLEHRTPRGYLFTHDERHFFPFVDYFYQLTVQDDNLLNAPLLVLYRN